MLKYHFKIAQCVLAIVLGWGLASCEPRMDELHFRIPDGYRGLIFTILNPNGLSSREGHRIDYIIPESGILYVQHFPRTDWFTIDAVTYSGKDVCTDNVATSTSSTVILTALRGIQNGKMDIYFLGTNGELNRIRELLEFQSDEEILENKSIQERRTFGELKESGQ